MRINEFFDDSFMKGIVSRPINENVKTTLSTIHSEVNELQKQVKDTNKEPQEVTEAIAAFLKKYSKMYASIRTILALNSQLRGEKAKEDDIIRHSPLVRSFFDVLINGSDEEVKKAMDAFYEKYIKSNDKISSAINSFERSMIPRMRGERGIFGVSVLDMIIEHLSLVYTQAADYKAAYREEQKEKKLAAKSVKESISEMFAIMDELQEQGLFELNHLNEAKQEPQAYYAIVSGTIIIDGDKKHRNVQSVVVAHAKDAISALRIMKKDIKASVSIINKELKKDKSKLEAEVSDKAKIMTFDEVKKKNIENLVGSGLVSRGFILLKGVMGNGNVGKEAEHAPFGHAFLNKSSVTRYLNKGR